MEKGFIALTMHNSSSEPTAQFRVSYEECVDLVHEHFLSYGFKMEKGKPFDPGHDDGADGGFESFDEVIVHGDKIAEFSHCDGDGPIGKIVENS